MQNKIIGLLLIAPLIATILGIVLRDGEDDPREYFIASLIFVLVVEAFGVGLYFLLS